MISLVCRDMHKLGGYQRARRTAAMASLNVGSRLSYHAAVRGRTAPIGVRTIQFAQTVTKENNPSSAVNGGDNPGQCGGVKSGRFILLSRRT